MDSPPLENQPCPLQFYNFSQLDYKQHCPIYSTVVGQEDHHISLEDVDGIESELMALQHSVQNRINLLESELVVLDNWQVKREYRKPSFTQPPAKKMKLDGESKFKNKKHSKSSAPPLESIMPAGKELGQSDLSIHSIKGDAPDRFWASVEPYCADITESDIQVLQDGIRSYEKREELYQIPPLGMHYSRHWALDDLQEEHGESMRLGQMADPLSLWDKPEEEVQEKESFGTILKDAESLNQNKDKHKSQCGPLTERLMAAFIEDPVGGGKASSRSHGPKLNVPSGTSQTETLEERIKNELIVLGLFDLPEIKNESDEAENGEDEILAELKRTQSELSSIMEYNREQREILLSLAKAEMKKQETRSQLKEVDDEIVDWLKKMNSNKQKRKVLGRKEKDSIWKLLETRDSLNRGD